MSDLALAIITHTPRHLRRCLLAVASSDHRPGRIAVSCDGNSPDLLSTARQASREFKLPMLLVSREHTGQSRSGQSRNNAVRALLAAGGADVPRDSRLVFFDGDCAPSRTCFDEHRRVGGLRGVVVGFRVDLSEEQTEDFDESAVKRGDPPAEISALQWAELERRDRRYRRTLFWRSLGLAKAHKPKILSANFSVPLATFVGINGFDEEFVGWGAEDDDVGRRLYAAGAPPCVGVRACVVYHQWHATRAPASWNTIPGADRFLRGTPTKCERGIENPIAQPPVSVEVLDG